LFMCALSRTTTDGTPPLEERYAILNVLGEGPYGITYVARARQSPCMPVAVKILKAKCPAEEWEARLQRYLDAVAGIEHLATAHVVDVGVTGDGRAFVATEFIAGRPILSYCTRGRLAPDMRLRLFAEVCTSIDGAHRHGLAHGHLVSENVLVTNAPGRHTRVMDFALSELSGDPPGDSRDDLRALALMIDALQPSGEAPADNREWTGVRTALSRAIASRGTAGDVAAAARALVPEHSSSS
jgi:serine/threonine protein kinase